MRYDACIDCGVEKIGRKQKNPRCGSCANRPRKLGKPRSQETIEKIRAGNKGKIRSLTTRIKVSLSRGGDGDIENRKYPGINRWTRLVKERDGRCTMCGTTQELEAHHIIPKAAHPQLATVLENGITLCAGCHRLEPWAIHKTDILIFSRDE